MTEYSPNGRHNGLANLEMSKVIRAVVYSRVSTDAQERDGTSLILS